jgi:hypothetical protein
VINYLNNSLTAVASLQERIIKWPNAALRQPTPRQFRWFTYLDQFGRLWKVPAVRVAGHISWRTVCAKGAV